MKSSGLFGNRKSDEIEKIAQDFMVASLEAMKQGSDEPAESPPEQEQVNQAEALDQIEPPLTSSALSSPHPPSWSAITTPARNPNGPTVNTLSEEEKTLLLGIDLPDSQVGSYFNPDDSPMEDESESEETLSLADQIRLNATEQPVKETTTPVLPELPTPQEDTPPQNPTDRAANPELLETLLKEIVIRDIARHRYCLSWEK